MKPLVGLRTPALTDLAQRLGAEPFRGRQIARWVYRRAAGTFDQMTDLPKPLRKQLAAEYTPRSSQVAHRAEAADGAVKLALRLPDKALVECVHMPSLLCEAPTRTSGRGEARGGKAATICVSTQVGCPVGCGFCATGAAGLARNLTAGEIVEQVLTAVAETAGGPVADLREQSLNVVYMGMGEPFLNYQATLESLALLREEVGIGARAVTVSTVGVPDRIRQFARDQPQVNLAVSVHAPTDELRRQLVGRAAQDWTVSEVLEAVRDYLTATNRRVSFEYVLLRGVNDADKEAQALAEVLHGLLCHVNLIPYNSTDAAFKPPAPGRAEAFRRALESAGVATTVRHSRGQDIAAACGQLRARQAGQADRRA